MKIILAIFWNENFHFFECELPLILRVDRKQKKNALEIFARGPWISNLNEIGNLV